MNKFIILLFFTTTCFSQSHISLAEMVQKPQLTSSNEHRLFFVDMWATWCVPCVTAKKYLGVVQQQFPKDLLVISIANENTVKVKKYLDKNPTKLAIGIDYNSQLYNKVNPRSFPHGILFNAQGDILWEGISTNMKPKMIETYLKTNQSKVAIQDFFKIIKDLQKDELINYNPANTIEYKELDKTIKLKRIENDSVVKYVGSLQMIISDLAKLNQKQIIIDEQNNKTYELYFKKGLSEAKIAMVFLKSIGIRLKTEKLSGEVLVLDNTQAKYWDTDQINWGLRTPKFLTNKTDIEADNASLKDVAHLLSKLLDKPVIVKIEDNSILEPHDWQLHYKYENFMIENFSENYNINVEATTAEYLALKLTPY